jgi:hypothetical protein
MFLCGAQYWQILNTLANISSPVTLYIYRENEDRMRMLCGRLKRPCSILYIDVAHDSSARDSQEARDMLLLATLEVGPPR